MLQECSRLPYHLVEDITLCMGKNFNTLQIMACLCDLLLLKYVL